MSKPIFAPGDENSFREFIDRYSDKVYNTIRLQGILIFSAQDVEEITADTFIQAWCERDKYDPTIGNPEQWLMNLARLESLHYLTRVRRDNRRQQAYTEALKAQVGHRLLEQRVQRGDIDALMEFNWLQLKRWLDPEDYILLKERYWFDKSFREIGKILHMPVSTVRSRHARLLHRVRKLLENESQSESSK